MILSAEGHVHAQPELPDLDSNDLQTCYDTPLYVGRYSSTFVFSSLTGTAPEVLIGADVRPNIAVWWTFGAMLYKMLTGTVLHALGPSSSYSPPLQLPWCAEYALKVFRGILAGPIEFPEGLHPDAVSLLSGVLYCNPAHEPR